VLGWRFFPRYFFLLLPALTIAAARRPRLIAFTAVLLAIPLIRFAPRYINLNNWTDLALDEDSRAASRIALGAAQPSSTLYVWGYRPEMFVYTGLKPATKYLECQALTGVPADRHLTQAEVVLTEGTHEAREELVRAMPDILIDGLSPYNPALSMDHYPELKPWLANYREIGRTKGSIIYALISVTELRENEKPQATPKQQQQQPSSTLRLEHPDPSHPRNWALWDPACDVDAEYADWFK
jgi:hypothetical protein